jgi:hypothetical protein
MNPSTWRRAATAVLICAGALLSSCDGGDSNSGVGFSVGLPTNYGSMELGMATTNWAGGPFWN